MVYTISALVSNDAHDMWEIPSKNGHRVSDMYDFIVPYIADKSAWPYARDIQYWDQWPARHVALVLGAIALNEPGYVALWSNLKTATGTFELLLQLQKVIHDFRNIAVTHASIDSCLQVSRGAFSNLRFCTQILNHLQEITQVLIGVVD